MKLINLKIKPTYFLDLLRGAKTFEVRKNDRDYQVGDLITFSVVNNDGLVIKGTEGSNFNLFVIVYVLKDCPQYGLADGYAILSLKRLISAD